MAFIFLYIFVAAKVFVPQCGLFFNSLCPSFLPLKVSTFLTLNTISWTFLNRILADLHACLAQVLCGKMLK